MGEILTGILIVLENLAQVLCCNTFLRRKPYRFTLYWCTFLGWCVACCIVGAVPPIQTSWEIRGFVFITLASVAIHILYDGNYGVHLLLAVLLQALIYFYDFLFFTLFTVIYEIAYIQVSESGLLLAVLSLTSKIGLLLTMVLVNRYAKNIDIEKIDWRKTLLLFSFPCASVLSIVCLWAAVTGAKINQLLSLFCVLALLLANAAVFVFVYWLHVNARENEKNALLNQQLHLQTEGILALQDAYASQRRISHDFHAHLEVLAGLLAKDDAKQAEGYVEKLREQHTTRTFVVNTHNAMVDALLNQKYALAAASDIDMLFQVNDLSGLRMDAQDIVVLLSNLIDNAVEAVKRLPSSGQAQREIQMKLLLNEEELFVSVRNNSLPVEMTEGRLKTTKADEAEHGFGMENVKAILTKYGAEIFYNYQEGWFQFVAEIPNTLRSR